LTESTSSCIAVRSALFAEPGNTAHSTVRNSALEVSRSRAKSSSVGLLTFTPPAPTLRPCTLTWWAVWLRTNTSLNKGVGKTVLGVPSMETIRQQTAGHALFMQMDGTSAYNQWGVTTRAGRSMAMILPPRKPGGRPRIIIPHVLWFGHEAAPGNYNCVMEHVFKDVPDTHIYLDDLLSGVSTIDEGLARFRILAERARKHHMMLAWSKFNMLVSEIRCLAFLVNKDGIRPDEERCRELVEWPEPTTRRELWSYLGLYAYLAHTMPQSTTESLRQLQAALNAPTFKWTDELSKAFVITKALGTRWVPTATLDYGRPVIIQTDSSKVDGQAVSHFFLPSGSSATLIVPDLSRRPGSAAVSATSPICRVP
jgi:hypothetical protein